MGNRKMGNRTEIFNGTGLLLYGGPDHRMKEIKIYQDKTTIYIETTIRLFNNEEKMALQYISPSEAMAFAKAFERCAIAAFKESVT